MTLKRSSGVLNLRHQSTIHSDPHEHLAVGRMWMRLKLQLVTQHEEQFQKKVLNEHYHALSCVVSSLM